MQTEPFQRLSFCGTLPRIIDVYTNSLLTCLKISSTILLIPWILLAVINHYVLVSLEKDTNAIFVFTEAFLTIFSDADGGGDYNKYRDIFVDDDGYYNKRVLETKTNITLTVLFLLNAIVIIVTHTFSYVAYIMAATQIYLGEEPEFLPCLKRSRGRFFSMMGANILYVVTLAGLCVVATCSFILAISGHNTLVSTVLIVLVRILILIAFYVGIRLSLYNPPIIVENFSACSSLRRSWNVASGNMCYIFCIFLIGTIVVVSCKMILMAFSPSFYIDIILNMIITFLLHPVGAIFKTVLYFSLRVKKEGMDLERLRQDINGTGEEPYIEVQMAEGIIRDRSSNNEVV